MQTTITVEASEVEGLTAGLIEELRWEPLPDGRYRAVLTWVDDEMQVAALSGALEQKGG